MIIKCVVQDDDSIILYKNDEVFIYMVRKPKWGGRFIGEIYNANDKLLIKLDSNVFRSIKIIYQNLEIHLALISSVFGAYGWSAIENPKQAGEKSCWKSKILHR